MSVLLCSLVLLAPVAAVDVSDEVYAKFPRLYHLDDYSSCLAQPDGLYCLGTFRLQPAKEPDPLYNLMKEYSADPHNFNRTELHRGYCVSSRCPSLASERNTSLRFEQCALHWARRRSLRTTLTKLNYCRTHAQEYARVHNPEPLDVPEKVFLLAVVAIVALNVIGTVYDVVSGDDNKKHPLLVSWSIPHNWRRLTTTAQDDPRLSSFAPIQGLRVFMMSLIIITHSSCIQDMLYLYNPRWIEQTSRNPALMLFLNGTSTVQMFVILSNFLLAYNMLLYSKTKQLNYRMLPLITLKRIFRLSPVNLLVVGFAATWWVRSNSGPLWPAMVGAETAVCRRKFWSHFFYVNNLVDADDICLVQTWFLAVDMQLYILSSLLTIALIPLRRRALPILAALVVITSVLNGGLAYVFDWKSIVYFAYPSLLHTMYRGVSSFTWLYSSTWGSLPACFIGLFIAHAHFEIQEAGVKINSYKWPRLLYDLSLPGMAAWILAGNWVRLYREPWFTATYAALERPVFSILSAIMIMGFVNGFDGWLRNFFAWRGWNAMGRVSLSVLMVHWCINMTLAASRPQPIGTSVLSVLSDWITTKFFSYLVAVPLTVMVEMPVQKFINLLV